MVIVTVRMPVATIWEGRLGHRLMQQDIRMSASRGPAAGGIQRRGITVVSGRTVDIHWREPRLVVSGLIDDHRGRWASSERSW